MKPKEKDYTYFMASQAPPKREDLVGCTEPMLPRLSRVKGACIAVGFALLAAAGSILSLKLESAIPLWVIGILLVAALLASTHLRRCPGCGGRLRFRQAPLPQSPSHFRLLFACTRCDMVWDSGRIETVSSG